MKTKLIGIIVCMLLVGTVLPASGTLIIDTTTTCNVSGNILYVGGSGEGNYTRIQEAIDDANIGDTIFVYDESSPYNENLVINKSISLIGENKETTVIDGGSSGDVIWINFHVDGVTISGFILKNGKCGIHFIESSHHTITDNIFLNNYFPSVDSLVSENNTIKNNEFNSNFYGVYFFRTTDSIISKNTFASNNLSIYLKSSSNNNEISYNSISDSIYAGLRMYHHCKDNVIFCNNLTSTLEIIDDTCIDNLFYHNNFFSLGGHASDKGSNDWDNGKEGNYWHDYEGYDIYPKDGIGDIPYEIFGGDNQDNYPLIEPWPKSKPRTISRNTALYSFYLLRLLEQFPILQKILLLQR